MEEKKLLSALNLFKVETREVANYQKTLTCILLENFFVYGATNLKTYNTTPVDHNASLLFSVFLMMHKQEVPDSKMCVHECISTIETTN